MKSASFYPKSARNHLLMQPLHTTLLNNQELTTTCTRLLPLCLPLFAGQPFLLVLAAAVEGHCTAIIEAGTRDGSSGFTDATSTADAKRDAAFSTLRKLADTAVHHPLYTAEQHAAGARITAIFARHGNTLHRLGNNRQTGKMNELIKELGEAGPTADLAAITLAPVFAAMVAAQAAFEAVISAKNTTEGADDTPTITEHRPLLVRQLNLLLDIVAEWQVISPSPALELAISKMDEVIVQIATPALARRTLAETVKPEPVPPVVPDGV